MTLIDVFLVISSIFAAILVVARLINGPFGKDRGRPLPHWEWYREDHEPASERDNVRGHWVC